MRALRFLLLITCLLAGEWASAQKALPSYQVFFGRTPQGWLTLRRWQDDGAWSYWIVNPATLRTSWYTGPAQPLGPMDWYSAVIGTPYGLALASERWGSVAPPGVPAPGTDTTRLGFTLTVDLCDSRRPLDRQFFTDLAAAFGKEARPVPVAVCLTGAWMKANPDDVGWLRKQNALRQLAITWVSHGAGHSGRGAPGPDAAALRQSILQQEQAMLAIPLRPAVLFRFPGPAPTRALRDSVMALGLLPFGSDAGLPRRNAQARDQVLLRDGEGGLLDMDVFFYMVRQQNPALRRRHYLLYTQEKDAR